METPPSPDLPEVADEHLAGERLFAAVTSLARWARIAAILLLILGTLSILSDVGGTALLRDSSTSFEVVLIVVGLLVATLVVFGGWLAYSASARFSRSLGATDEVAAEKAFSRVSSFLVVHAIVSVLFLAAVAALIGVVR